MEFLLSKKNCRAIANKPYTLKEIMENKYPEPYETINSCFHDLENWQNTSLKKLPLYKKQVLDNKDNWKSIDAQIHLMNYIKLCSLYGFAHYIWKQINDHCHKLASYYNENNEEGVAKEETSLLDLMNRFSQISIKGIAEDEVTGFFRLYRVVESFDQREDVLNVLEWFDEENRPKTCSYRDIIGIINSNGLQDEGLWKRALKSIEPTELNISGLMESEEDNELARMYYK